MIITEEQVLEDIKYLLAHKVEHGIAPTDQVTRKELDTYYQNLVAQALNKLFVQKKIYVGPTMNGKYIKLKDAQ